MNSPQLRNQKIGAEIEVRACTTLDELEDCVRVQREVWNFSDAELVPADIFIVAQKTGGQIIGAFDDERLVGFTLAFMAAHGRESYLHSHFAAVLSDYQGRGIGRILKLAQRENALSRGIRLIEWTFDPLALMNAHFNLNRLGAIVRRYLPNVYGVTSSPLHGSIPTDRLVAEWWLESPRVVALAENRSVAEEQGEVQVTLPRNATELLRAGDPQASLIQDRVRREFQEQLAKGYAAVAVRFADSQASYCLSRASGIQLPSP
ncbi:MAG: GNAT family N-acetyltransferase [Acidobacteriaceae bacterium]